MKIQQITQHPLAKRFRPFTSAELQRLRDSVTRLGVLEPVTILDGMVLDGWHRFSVARELGVDCPTAEYSGSAEDIELWLSAKNEARRHLGDLQFAIMIANSRESQKFTAVNASDQIAKTDKDLAAEHGIKPNMLSTARKVLESGDDELIEEATSGHLGRTEARKKLRENWKPLGSPRRGSPSRLRPARTSWCAMWLTCWAHVEPRRALLRSSPTRHGPIWQAWQDLARVSLRWC